ncbi:MAG: hypothetical protein ACXVAX_07280 [Pseudobdellovibrio sp.]
MRTILMTLALLFSFQLHAADLDGKYTYLGFDSNFKEARYDISISDMKMDLPGDQPSLKGIQVSEGGQDDFMATLKNGVPAGIKLYKADADIQGAGQKTKITLVVQTLDNNSPRLSLYAILDGRPAPLMKAYSSDQADALQAAEDKMKP